jgi:hypothetical protein
LLSDAQLAAGSTEAATADWQQQQQQQLPHSCQEQQQQLPNNPTQQGENQGKAIAVFFFYTAWAQNVISLLVTVTGFR